MTKFVLIQTPVPEVEMLSERIWALPGILGIEELPADGKVFRPDLAHHFVRFDGRAQFEEWLRTEEFRQGNILLKVYHTGDFPGDFAIVAHGTVEPEDSLAQMRAQHHGRVIGSFWVGPPWEKAGERPVLIEPGTAFGLGDHPTTQMCLELLSGQAERILDFGAGSGILSIAAARLWPDCDLTLVEIDRQCWPNIEHNFALNGLPAPAIHATVPAGRFDLVLANIYLEVLKTVLAIDAPRFIVSGLLGAEQLAALPLAGCRITRQLQREDWFALELERC